MPTVRRLIIYVLFFVLVVIGAIGLAGLLGRLINARAELVAGDTADLARSLAFTLIGGPLAGLLWWMVWRRARAGRAGSAGLGPLRGRDVGGVAGHLREQPAVAASNLVGGDWRPQTVATGVVWAGVWRWHRWMAEHPERGPRCSLRSLRP